MNYKLPYFALLVSLLSLTVSFSQIFSDNCNGSPLANVELGFPQNFDPNTLSVQSIQLPYPVLTYAANSDDIYVVGGQPFSLDLFVNKILTGNSGVFNLTYYNQFSPYIVKIDPLTLNTTFLDLLGGSGIPYVGGVVAHPNGFIYSIAEGRLFKIDPTNMSIVSFIDLPLPDSFSIYNGVSVASNGNLITKSFILNDYSNGDFLMINPDNLETIDQLNTEVGTARINFACDDAGNEFIYHINQNFTFRILITATNLIMDNTWQATYSPYGSPNDTEPTSPRMLNNKVIYTTNTVPNSTQPMKIFWQDKNQSYDINTDSIDNSQFMFSDTVSPGFSFFGLTTDEDSNIIIGIDQLNGKIAAYTIDNSNQLIYLWEKSYGVTTMPTLDSSTGLVYINDFDQTQNTDDLVVLDILDGSELGRITTQGSVPSISNLVAGAYDDVYYCSNETGSLLGYFHRVTSESVLSTEDFIISNQHKAFNYPNPFTSKTTIEFELTTNSTTTINIYDVLGRHVENLLTKDLPSGIHKAVFDGSKYENGQYFYKINSNSMSTTGKMILNNK